MPRDATKHLPSEMMTEIFTIICGQEVLIPPPSDGCPWILGHVCSRWRQIVWNAPSIWNKIKIIHQYTNIPMIAIEGSVDEYKERYSVTDVLGYILSKIHGPVSLFFSEEGYLRNATAGVLQYLGRLSVLSITGLPEDTFLSIFKLPPTSFAQLEHLSLTPLALYGCASDYTTSPLQTAPNLRSVTYNVGAPIYYPFLLLLPWPIMNNISVEPMIVPLNIIWDIFRSSPSLASCSFQAYGPQVIPITPPISLTALSVLRLETEGLFDWESFLSSIITPSLQTLDLTSPRVPCAPLTSLVTRSCCSIQDLALYDYTTKEYVDNDELESLLHHLPLLTRLRLTWFIPPSIFKKIHDDAIIPKLVDAELYVQPDGLGAFLDMVDSRIISPRGIQGNFEIVCHRGPAFMEQRSRYLSVYGMYKTIKGLEIQIIDDGSNSNIEPDNYE